MLYKASITFYFEARDDQDAQAAVLDVLESELENEYENSQIELIKVEPQRDQDKAGYFDESGYFCSFQKNEQMA